MNASEIKRMIETGLPESEVAVHSEDGHHFEALVVYEGFRGKSLLERHRMVYEALGDSFKSTLHALAIRTQLPGEG
ncbi:BolA family protein [Nitrosococcus oceani]|uniref:Transcriptional regulator, BolA protein family n=2 Tax=Nitrosococcus oceani TaxID=1229 RepID=Q3J7G8_NITOC|nr:BolA/IbaG family iron-sulfur metabolism protein [Nitrosococcus oceani]KFI18256.1 BolA family transcriptional regulator [Nitrosococcus oceani C-27]ABA59228.1 transcriptional regulator, BolA protein family [Nitrosococcus oceani ATCC 19707]EDZ66077.1 BolA-like protein [Nitrosococcus oceani AFC27]KFI21434.1 BolA family transcriptional regulator [Nitrosococcus oceani]GEM21053.1 BolA family transcriptional regulator [Nitrosococcus oceani]